jgi:non-ribosomal peptide synthetase component F
MVPYGQLHNWLQASWARSPYGSGERTLQKTPITFVVSLKELLSGLLAGVTQVMVPDAVVKDSAALAQVIKRWKITRMHLVPSHLRALLDCEIEDASALQSLRTIVTAGEALPQALRADVRHKLPDVELWNNYGCTELNDVTYAPASVQNPDEVHAAFVAIGKPIHNMHVFVLDEQLRQVPVGVMGELHVDSPYMARGYWQQPELTAQRFIANPSNAGSTSVQDGRHGAVPSGWLAGVPRSAGLRDQSQRTSCRCPPG